MTMGPETLQNGARRVWASAGKVALPAAKTMSMGAGIGGGAGGFGATGAAITGFTRTGTVMGGFGAAGVAAGGWDATGAGRATTGTT